VFASGAFQLLKRVLEKQAVEGLDADSPAEAPPEPMKIANKHVAILARIFSVLKPRAEGVLHDKPAYGRSCRGWYTPNFAPLGSVSIVSAPHDSIRAGSQSRPASAI